MADCQVGSSWRFNCASRSWLRCRWYAAFSLLSRPFTRTKPSSGYCCARVESSGLSEVIVISEVPPDRVLRDYERRPPDGRTRPDADVRATDINRQVITRRVTPGPASRRV